jgi:hypothetical protein
LIKVKPAVASSLIHSVMMPYVDPWKAAVALIQRYGPESRQIASELVNNALLRGEDWQCILWVGVEQALDAFWAETRRTTETVQ